MILDWRLKWNLYTNNNTEAVFPFGFVILSTWNDEQVGDVRWCFLLMLNANVRINRTSLAATLSHQHAQFPVCGY